MPKRKPQAKTQTSSIRVSKAKNSKKLTAAQKKFNATIRQIEKQKKLLAEWQAAIPTFQQKRAAEYGPLVEKYSEHREAMVHRLDGFYARKSFSRLQKEKLANIICELCDELIPQGREELKPIYNKYNAIDFDTEAEEEAALANDMMRSMLESQFGIDLGDDFDVNQPEAMAERVEQKLREQQEAEEERDSKRKKTKHEQRRKAKQKAEEENVSQSIKTVYRQLTTALHPDREQDETERERKTELMQRVTRAYRDKDLLQLLELQLEVEQIDQHRIDGIADERLRHFNKVLERQLDELKLEIEEITFAFKRMAGFDPMASITPEKMMQAFERDIQALQNDIAIIELDLAQLKTVRRIQEWLKDYHLPQDNLFDDIFFIPNGFGR